MVGMVLALGLMVAATGGGFAPSYALVNAGSSRVLYGENSACQEVPYQPSGGWIQRGDRVTISEVNQCVEKGGWAEYDLGRGSIECRMRITSDGVKVTEGVYQVCSFDPATGVLTFSS